MKEAGFDARAFRHDMSFRQPATATVGEPSALPIFMLKPSPKSGSAVTVDKIAVATGADAEPEIAFRWRGIASAACSLSPDLLSSEFFQATMSSFNISV